MVTQAFDPRTQEAVRWIFVSSRSKLGLTQGNPIGKQNKTKSYMVKLVKLFNHHTKCDFFFPQREQALWKACEQGWHKPRQEMKVYISDMA